MTIALKITAKRDRLVAIKDSLTALKAVAEEDDFESFTEDQIKEIETLSDEEASVIKDIETLEMVEKGLAAQAQPATGAPAPAPAQHGTGGAFPRQEKAGDLLVKTCVAKLIAHETGTPISEVMELDYFRSDDRIKASLPLYAKSAVPPATSTQAGWAAELVDQDLAAFLEDLGPVSVYAALRANSGYPFTFDRTGKIVIPRRDGLGGGAGRTEMAGSFVGEGGVIPVKRMTLGSTTLLPYKMAVISVMTNEVMNQSAQSLEAIVRAAMIEDTAVALDNALMDAAAAVTGVRPASITNGVTGQASAGTALDNILTDLKYLLDTIRAGNLGARPWFVMNDARALSLRLLTNALGAYVFRDEIANGTLINVPILTSTTVPADQVLCVDANSFASANGVPEISVSDQTVLTMANADGTAPTQAVDAAGAIATPEQVGPGLGISVAGGPSGVGTAGYEAVSMFQTSSTAIKMLLPTSWDMIRPGTVSRVTGVSW